MIETQSLRTLEVQEGQDKRMRIKMTAREEVLEGSKNKKPKTKNAIEGTLIG
jgi:hypothetical protein